MNKNISLAFILFTTTSHILSDDSAANTPSYWQIVINLIYGKPQPQENPDQAPAGVTEDNYIAQFRSDMNGRSCIISLNEMQEMETAIRKELRNIDLRDKDLANQTIRSILCSQVKTGTKQDMEALTCEEGFYYTRKQYETIPTSYENNMIARLGRMPHLNGEALAEYFGEARKNSLRHELINRNTYR